MLAMGSFVLQSASFLEILASGQSFFFGRRTELYHSFYLEAEGHDETLRKLAAAAAKSLQSCPTLCNPTDGSPPGSPVPGILQARVLEWGAIAKAF